MFSFRTTSLEEQMDRALTRGSVGCFCTQNCWDTVKGRYTIELNAAIKYGSKEEKQKAEAKLEAEVKLNKMP